MSLFSSKIGTSKESEKNTEKTTNNACPEEDCVDDDGEGTI